MSTNARRFFLNEVEDAISQVNKLSEEVKAGQYTGIEQTHELQAVLNDLRKIKSEILTNSVPPKKNRFLSYEVFIIENWGIRHPLGSKLLDIATKYTCAI